MSTPPVGSADQSSSPALQRWLDVLSQGAAARAATAVAIDAASQQRAAAPRADLLPADLTAHRLEPAALGAHAAVGELSVQRRTFAAVEDAISASSRGLVDALAAVDDAYRRAARSDAPNDRSAAARATRRGDLDARRVNDDRASADAERVASRRALHDAIGDAVREFDATDARLTELRDAAREAVRDTAARVGTLADEVAAYARSRHADRWTQAELDDRTGRADERRRAMLTDDARARERRDTAVRELGRLVGATARENVDGTLDVVVGDQVIVRGDTAAVVSVHEGPDGSATLRVGDADLDGHSGALAALVQAGDRAVEASRVRVAEVGRAFAAEIERRQDLGRDATATATADAGPDASAAAQPASTARPIIEVDGDGRLRLAGTADDVVVAPEPTRPAASSPTQAAADRAEAAAPGAAPTTRAEAAPADSAARQAGSADAPPQAGAVSTGSSLGAGRVPGGAESLPAPTSRPAAPSGPAAPGAGGTPALGAGAGGGTPTAGAAGPAVGAAAAAGLTPQVGAPGVVAAPGEDGGSPIAGGGAAGGVGDALSVAAAQGRFAAAVTGVLDDLLAQAGNRRQVAERRLDVLSVVDSLLAGAPTSQVGGLVRAALGAVTAPGGGVWRTSQELVTAFQALDGQTLALGRSAEPLIAAPPLTYATLSDDALGVAVGPVPGGASAADPATSETSPTSAADHPSLLGRFGDLLGAVGAALTGSSAPVAPFEAQVDVVSVARAGASVSQAAFPAGHVLAGGTPFALTLTEGAGDAAITHRVALRAGTTLHGVAAALDAVATHVRAGVVSAAGGGERLLLSGVGTGLRTRADVTDGRVPSAPSAVLGAFRPAERAADTVLSVQFSGRPAQTVSSPTTVVDDALPGLRITVDAAAAGRTVHVTAYPGADELADHVEALTRSGDALLRSLGGAGVVAPAAASALAADPVVGDLAARVAAALSGASVVPATAVTASAAARPAGSALSVGEGGDPPPPTPIAGLRASAGNASFDRGAFLRALVADPAGVEAATRSVAHEVRALAQDATDPRAGLLAVRIMGEQAFAQEYSVGQADADERMHDRHDLAQRRLHAMQSLLTRLDEQAEWLRVAVE